MKIFKILAFMWIIFPWSAFAIPEATLVPNEIVDGFLTSYSPEEKVAIGKDYKNIRELCLSQADKEQKKLIYVATAGGPGASKSTIDLHAYLVTGGRVKKNASANVHPLPRKEAQ